MGSLTSRSIRKVTRNGNASVITLPRPMMHRLGWTRGTELSLEVIGRAIVVRTVDDEVLDRRGALPDLELARAIGGGQL